MNQFGPSLSGIRFVRTYVKGGLSFAILEWHVSLWTKFSPKMQVGPERIWQSTALNTKEGRSIFIIDFMSCYFPTELAQDSICIGGSVTLVRQIQLRRMATQRAFISSQGFKSNTHIHKHPFGVHTPSLHTVPDRSSGWQLMGNLSGDCRRIHPPRDLKTGCLNPATGLAQTGL